jgi:hypothetical protein
LSSKVTLIKPLSSQSFPLVTINCKPLVESIDIVNPVEGERAFIVVTISAVFVAPDNTAFAVAASTPKASDTSGIEINPTKILFI